MRTNLHSICKLCCMLMLSLGVLTGCEDNRTTDIPNSAIRPCKLEMAGVYGFVVASNTSNNSSTRADYDGDGTEDGYSLYTIDENGDLHLSIFYFEVVENEGGEYTEQGTKVTTELSNALQIVPSLVTDLGKYILFSGCKYQIIASELSNKVQSICDSFLQYNWRWEENAFMIRKSDGAMFDLSNQPIFTYCYWDYTGNFWWFDKYYCDSYNPVTGSRENWTYIPSHAYTTSTKGNLFTRGWRSSISKFEDKGDSIKVRQITHNYGDVGTDDASKRSFTVDKNENIYEFFGNGIYGGRPSSKGPQLDIYYADGRFNVYNLYEFQSNHLNFSDSWLFDFITDESGVPYLFLFSEVYDGYDWPSRKVCLLSASMTDGFVTILGEEAIICNGSTASHWNGGLHYHYLGFYNNSFNWYLPIHREQADNRPISADPDEILSYNKSTNKWSKKTINSNLMQIITDDYDAWISGKKCYGTNINGNNIEVIEIDIASETSRTYTFTVDLSFIISPSYSIRMMQDVPYLAIDGRSAADGTGISFRVNLINGDNNSTFASDNRTVVSFFRIN